MTTDLFRNRAERIAGMLRGRIADGWILFPGVEMYYFTGFRIDVTERPTCALIPFDGEPLWIVPTLERDLRGCKTWIRRVETWEEEAFDVVADRIAGAGLADKRVAVCDTAPWGWVRRMQDRLPRVRFVSATATSDSLRARKEPAELDAIRKACDIIVTAVKKGFASLCEGMSERELALEIGREVQRQGASVAFCLVLFGERAALPHGMPSDRRLHRGDGVLVDAGCRADEYVSDITRTVVFGEPTGRQRDLWQTVLRAYQAAARAIRPSVTGAQADAIARKVIADAGFGEFFIHRLGHGLGLLGHEPPYLAANNDQPLQEGAVFTIEPGIYIPGEGGVRLENTVLLTGDGCEPLTKMDMDIHP